MKILNLEQGTKEWHDARRCIVTGTKLDDVMGTTEAQIALIAEFIGEEATEQSKILMPTAEMERGTAEEVFAIKEFEKVTGKKVTRVGMCLCETPGLEFVGNSPDGLIINKDGKVTEAIEVKSPDTKKAILYRIQNAFPLAELGLLTAKGLPKSDAPFLGVPAKYKWQIVNYFLVNPDLETLHFVAYDSRMIADDMKLYTVKVERTNEVLQEAVKEATDELARFKQKWDHIKSVILPSAF